MKQSYIIAADVDGECFLVQIPNVYPDIELGDLVKVTGGYYLTLVARINLTKDEADFIRLLLRQSDQPEVLELYRRMEVIAGA